LSDVKLRGEYLDSFVLITGELSLLEELTEELLLLLEVVGVD